MPDDRDLTGDDRGRANISGEPLTASVRDILDEHADTERRALEERQAEEAEQQRMERMKADQAAATLRHTGGQRRLRPRRDSGSKRGSGTGQESSGTGQDAGLDPRLLAGAALLGVVLAGGLRRVIVLGAIAAGGWALYRRILEPARDPSVVLQ